MPAKGGSCEDSGKFVKTGPALSWRRHFWKYRSLNNWLPLSVFLSITSLREFADCLHSAPLRGPEKLSFLTKKIYLLRPGGQGAAMKQAIAGIAGLKPRASKPEGDGKLSKQESHALDAEYRRQRNLAASIEKSEGANALGEGPRRIG